MESLYFSGRISEPQQKYLNMKNVHLLTIDPQNDFCTPQGSGGEKATLLVGGAEGDMSRLASFITKNATRLSEINCTLDSHQAIHIAHPTFWVDSKGNHPNPFTLVSADDVRKGTWRSYNPRWQTRAQTYVDTLAKNGRYVLCIWPLHCLIGTWGHAIVPSVAAAFYQWEVNTFNRVNFVAKGSNLFTEHYSAVQADVPDDNDASTKLNTSLVDALTQADEILITGEALSHCVANSIRDIASTFGDDNIKKFTFLEDTSSNVSGFEKLGQDFVKEMVARGMQRTTTKDW
jgi:nicotinamidase-related amidase